MPSTEEIRWFAGVDVGVRVCRGAAVAVGRIVSGVKGVRIVVVGGMFVGVNGGADCTMGTSVAVQAVRKNRETMLMNLFMMDNSMLSCAETEHAPSLRLWRCADKIQRV